MDFEEMVQSAVNAKAKAGIRSSTMVRDSDIRCPKVHRPSNSTTSKVQTQGTTTKNSHPEEPKVKEPKPTPSRAEASKPSEQARKEKKKKRHQERQNKEQTLASIANATEV